MAGKGADVSGGGSHSHTWGLSSHSCVSFSLYVHCRGVETCVMDWSDAAKTITGVTQAATAVVTLGTAGM